MEGERRTATTKNRPTTIFETKRTKKEALQQEMEAELQLEKEIRIQAVAEDTVNGNAGKYYMYLPLYYHVDVLNLRARQPKYESSF